MHSGLGQILLAFFDELAGDTIVYFVLRKIVNLLVAEPIGLIFLLTALTYSLYQRQV